MPITPAILRKRSRARTLLTDTFTDTNGVALASHTPEVGPAWAQRAGTFLIQSNTLQQSGAGDATYRHLATVPLGVADVRIDATITLSNSGALGGIVLRWVDNANHWYIATDPATGAIQLFERIAGTFNLRAQGAYFLTTAAVSLSVVASGSTIVVFADGVIALTYAAATGFLTATHHGFRAANATTTTFDTMSALAYATRSAVTVPGVWTWYNDPRVLAYGTGQLAVGYVTKEGHCAVANYDTVRDRFTGTALLRRSLEIDDHDNPAFLRRASDGRIMAWYCAHNGASYYQRISTNADDVTTWGTETDLDSQLGLVTYAYANPIQLTGETNTPIYLFMRGDPGSGWAQNYSKSIDGGTTWTAVTRWLENGTNRPYLKVARNGTTRIDFLMTDGHPVTIATSIYHGYYEGGNLYKSDGTLVGALGAGYLPTQFTKIYDGATTRAWNHAIAIDGTGKPVVAYATFPSATDHRYRYARWNGSAWVDNQICTAGRYLYSDEMYYSGGVTIDPADVNTIYASRDTGDTIHQIWKGVTADSGATWTLTQLTSGTEKAFRPHVAGGKVLYATGSYTSYTSYDTRIATLTP